MPSLPPLLLSLTLIGCSTLPRLDRPRPEPQTDRTTPIAKALDYILKTQWTADTVTGSDLRWVGNWPQTLEMSGVPIRIPEVSGGCPAFIHYALCHITEGTASRLGLRAEDVRETQVARQRTARFLEHFQGPPGPLHAAFGWWPIAQGRPTPIQRAIGRWTAVTMGGPYMCGTRASPSIPTTDPSQRLPADNDDSAYIHMALALDQSLDGGPGPPPGLGDVLTRWRDDGIARRVFPRWLPQGSGAFLTQFARPGPATFDNDIDLPALANCVWALAALGQTDTPGYAESLTVLNDAIRAGRHRCPRRITRYYSSRFALHALVARAHVEGPVPELADAVQILADDVASRARCGHWPGKTPASDAALAISTLVYAGRHGPLVDRACDALIELQDPRTGAWPDEPLAFGTTTTRRTMQWRCPAATTGFALAALIVAKLGPVRAQELRSDEVIHRPEEQLAKRGAHDSRR